MDNYIKNCADSFDLQTLKYIFVDALEVDPTFVRYEKEYHYCQSIPDLLEPHQELTPFSENPDGWDEDYWENLKMDLLQNFSHIRMMHMKDVAQVILAEKVERILQERSAANVSTPAEPVEQVPVAPVYESLGNSADSHTSDCETETVQADESPDVTWSDNEYRLNSAQLKKRAKQLKDRWDAYQSHTTDGMIGDWTKKALGIAIVVLAVTVIALILILQ